MAAICPSCGREVPAAGHEEEYHGPCPYCQAVVTTSPPAAPSAPPARQIPGRLPVAPRSLWLEDDDDEIPLDEIRPSRRPKWVTDTSVAERKVRAPAIALLIYSGLGMAFAILGPLLQISFLSFGGMTPATITTPELVIQFGSAVVNLLYNGYIFWAAWQMKALRGYGHAYAASIMTIIPCFGVCCLIGIGLGTWSLTVLNQREVKDAFQQRPDPGRVPTY